MVSILEAFGVYFRGLEAAGAPIACLVYHLGVPRVAMVPQKVLNGVPTWAGALFCQNPVC